MNREERRKAVWKCQEIYVRDQPQTAIITRNQIMAYNARDWDNLVAEMGEGLNSLWNFQRITPKSARKVLRWGYPSDIGTLNPMAATNNHDFQILRLIYDRLLQNDQNGVPQNWAAEDVKLINDTTVDVTIKSGMKFHDGKPVTVEDVKFSFEYPVKVKSAYFLNQITPIKEVTITGQRTLRFTLHKPFAPFFANTLGVVFILPKHIWEGIPEKAGVTKAQDFSNLNPVGSGMFKLEYWRRNEEMKLARHEAHQTKPNIEAIVKIPYANTQGLVAGVETGEADIAGWWIEPLQVTELARKAPHVKVVEAKDHGYYHINYNMRRKPFDDVPVRRALAHGIPKQLILERLLEGHGDITESMIAPCNTYWHNPTLEKIEFNVEKGRQILKTAGYEWGPDGRIYYPAGKTN